ncbi:methionine--tRNA ligase [Candidatus Uhrbacteria bacterium]|nr:methionine--tRNA ligase [Candidatus Uhrbacteria bacterium]
MNKYYITTPIYYVNDRPHIGHAYTTVVADALARYHRLRHDATYFVTGTDENSQKNVQAMEKAGENDLAAYLERMAIAWYDTWRELGISFDNFIRTTEARHLAGVARFWNAVQASGDIYEGTYEGLYCTGCEAFKTETELIGDKCPLHPNKDLEHVKEKNYFFRLSAYRDELLKLYAKGSDFVMPESRRHEIHNYVEDHLADVSISREAKSVPVGISVPGDLDQRIYVWFDALLNYMTAVGYGTDEAQFSKFWPADLHLVGKDIIKFHCALWPAMIMSAAKNDPLLRHADGSAKIPKQVHAHGFFTMDGVKISKSLGNAVDPREFIPHYGFDAVRYFLLREIPFGEDGDFSRERLASRYASDLGNTFGNLVNRAIAMSKKYFDGNVPPADITESSLPVNEQSVWDGKGGLDAIKSAVESAYAGNRCDVVLASIWDGVGDTRRSGLFQANKLIEETQPFKLVKEDPEAVGEILYALLESLRWYAWLVHPIMPNISVKIFEQLGLDARQELSKGWVQGLKWGGLVPGAALGEPSPLFPRPESEGV